MIKNDSSISNITQNQDPVNTDRLPDPLPGLQDLKGGKKQAWNNANRELITLTYDQFGPDYTKALYNLKDTTLSRVLNTAERQHRPSYRKADQAMNKAYLNEKRILEELKPQFDSMAEAVLQHFDDDQALRKTLSDFFQLQAAANSMMAKIVQNPDYIMVNFTEHISSADTHKVDPTPLITEQNSTKRIKAGPTSLSNEGRLFISSKRETGKLHTSRSGKTHGTLRERYQNAKKRYRRV